MELRKLISKFLTSLVEKNYAQANDDLKNVVEEKIKQRVKASSDKLNRKKKLASKKSECSGKAKCHCADCEDSLKEESAAKPDYLDLDDDNDTTESMKSAAKSAKGKKGKLSKEENKKRFLEMIAKKKKNSKKGNK